MKLGASTLLFKERPLGRDLLADIAAAGVDSAELTDYHPGFSYEDPASYWIVHVSSWIIFHF